MMATVDVLEQARRDGGLSIDELWFRTFALGGMSSALEVEAILFGALVGTPQERDVLAVALNERFAELGGAHSLSYSSDDTSDRR